MRTEPDAIRAVRHAIESFAAERGFASARIRDLSIAVAEAMFNAMDHGGCRQEIVVHCGCDEPEGRLEVAVEDEGDDPDARCAELLRYLEACAADLPEADLERGRGLFLIRLKSDDVRIEKVGARGVRVIVVMRR